MLKVSSKHLIVLGILLCSFTYISKGVAQEADAGQPVKDESYVMGAAKEFLELADKNGAVGNYTRFDNIISTVRDANNKANNGKPIEAYTDIASEILGSLIIQKIITNPQIANVGSKICTSHVFIGIGCLATTAIITYNTIDIIKKNLAGAASGLQKGYQPKTDQAAPQVVAAARQLVAKKVINGRNLSGRWLFVNDGGAAKIGWIPSLRYPYFSGIYIACSLQKTEQKLITISLSIVGAKSGQKLSRKITRGILDLNISGIVEDGPDGESLVGSLGADKIMALFNQEGDIIVHETPRPWLYSSKTLTEPLGKFLKQCSATSELVRNVSGLCLSYQGRASILGVIHQKTYPGPPNYTNVASGDRPETVLVLKTEKVTCVDKDNFDPYEMSPALSNIKEIQLTATVSQLGAGMIGNKVEVSGKISIATTGHQHTPIVMDDVKVMPR